MAEIIIPTNNIASISKEDKKEKKQLAKAEKEAVKLAKKIAKEAIEAEKEALKVAKEAEKEALKVAKEAEKEALKVAKEALKAAKEAEKEASKIGPTTKFVASNKTILVNHGKITEWLCCGVPCQLISIDEHSAFLRPFNKVGEYQVSIKNYTNFFTELTRNESHIFSTLYPQPIPIGEFDVKPISISKLLKLFADIPSFVTLLEKAEQDSYIGKGNTFCINIKDYNEYNEKKESTKLQRVGDPIFNRASRHTVPIPSTFDRGDFENSPSFPAPIGIRGEDFALPSEQNEIMKEMLTQAFNCVGAPECPTEFREQLGITITPNSHICDWCGDLINISELNQVYCSKEHSLNFCHRDPTIGTKKGNVYIGHCSCNREQGGYSETQRVEQIIRLAKSNPYYLAIIKEGLGL